VGTEGVELYADFPRSDIVSSSDAVCLRYSSARYNTDYHIFSYSDTHIYTHTYRDINNHTDPNCHKYRRTRLGDCFGDSR